MNASKLNYFKSYLQVNSTFVFNDMYKVNFEAYVL